MFLQEDRVGPYTLIKFLGQGQFGTVWLAEKRGIATTQLALKLPISTQLDVVAVRKEAPNWARASGHPNVVPIIDADMYSVTRDDRLIVEKQLVIASEYVADGSLSDWMNRSGHEAAQLDHQPEFPAALWRDRRLDTKRVLLETASYIGC